MSHIDEIGFVVAPARYPVYQAGHRESDAGEFLDYQFS
jgi:hypothetical protein